MTGHSGADAPGDTFYPAEPPTGQTKTMNMTLY